VYTASLKLSSAFFDSANASIQFSFWFQPELPYPGVDLSKLRPKDEDTLPPDLEINIKNGKF